ncbi:MAG: nucleoside hydrolase-like domain-containing protein [Novosphingobium sp.]
MVRMTLALLLAVTLGAQAATNAIAAPNKARLIVLTDIGNEPDDSESMVRLLLYANDIDIEGLVAATSRHLPKNPHPEMIQQRIAAYAQVLPNLRKHDENYPDAEFLRSRLRTGSPVYGMTGVGEGRDTAASRLIIAAVDRPDPRPVWIAAWGGAADLAQALSTVRATRSPAQVDRFVAKLRVYSISDQDDAGPWARAYFPKLFWETGVHGFTRYQLGTWLGISSPLPGADQTPVSKEWLEANIRSKGLLGAVYPVPAYIMEGDTPSFLSLIPNGLSVPERPDWGGWGGRYDKISDALGLWTTTTDMVRGTDGKMYSTPQATVWRWRWAFQNDFAARMAWSLSPDVRQANHAPQVMLNGKDGLAPFEISGCAGKPITLSARGSVDPDGDQLSYRWWWYREASGLFAPEVTLSEETGETTTVAIGGTAHVDQFTPPTSYRLHVILEASDNGTPKLTRYRRVIITVPGLSEPTSAQGCGVAPVPPSH